MLHRRAVQHAGPRRACEHSLLRRKATSVEVSRSIASSRCQCSRSVTFTLIIAAGAFRRDGLGLRAGAGTFERCKDLVPVCLLANDRLHDPGREVGTPVARRRPPRGPECVRDPKRLRSISPPQRVYRGLVGPLSGVQGFGGKRLGNPKRPGANSCRESSLPEFPTTMAALLRGPPAASPLQLCG